MNFKTTFAVLALTVGLAQAASAATTTIDFTSGGTGASGAFFSDGTTYTASASGGFFSNFLGLGVGTTVPVDVSGSGLGVDSSYAGDNGQIDPDRSRFEMLTISFSRAVSLVGFSLSLIDNNDDFLVSINGGSFQQYGPGLGGGPFTVAVGSAVQSFRLLAVGELNEGPNGNDDFRLASATVVPVPAAGLMLLAGLGGLAALRRRRKALV